jgi:hypothetical protein
MRLAMIRIVRKPTAAKDLMMTNVHPIHQVTSDMIIAGGNYDLYVAQDSGFHLNFFNTDNDTLANFPAASGQHISGTNNTDFTINLAGGGNILNFGRIHGTMTINHFDDVYGAPDFLTLRNEGFASSAAVIAALIPDGRGSSILPLPGGASIHFVDSHFQSINIGVVNK